MILDALRQRFWLGESQLYRKESSKVNRSSDEDADNPAARFPVTSHETISRAAVQAGKSRKATGLVDVNSTWPKHMIRHVLLRVLFDCEVGNPLSSPKLTAEMSQQEEGGIPHHAPAFGLSLHL